MEPTRPVTLALPRGDGVLPAGAVALGGAEAAALKQQLSRGDLAGVRAYLARSRGECDWQDRIYMLGLVGASVRLPVLDFACESEPAAADVFLLRCVYFCELALTMRGPGPCAELAAGRMTNAAECVRAALLDLGRTAELDPEDPTAWAYVLPALTIFGETGGWREYAFRRATALAPGLVPAYRAMVSAAAERWHGSHAKSLAAARDGMKKAGPRSDMPACLFWAHLLVRSHRKECDKNPVGAIQYVGMPEVKRELEEAFDGWTAGLERSHRSSAAYFHDAACWFYLAGDKSRLRRALALTNGEFNEIAWAQVGPADKVYAKAVAAAAQGADDPHGRTAEPAAQLLAMVSRGAGALQDGDLAAADGMLRAAALMGKRMPREQGLHLLPLVVLHTSLLCHKQGRESEARRMRELGFTLLRDDSVEFGPAVFQHLMAQVLQRLGEYRRALPFWQQALRLAGESVNPQARAAMLQRLGECYNLMGLRDHAATPLRAALRIFRGVPEDPRLTGLLLTLGNALRKSSPTEAEALYREAAALHEAKLQLVSATPAWMNLALLYSEQGHHRQALDYCERVLRVREQTAGTPRTSLASGYTNLANCYRRMGRYAEAHQAVSRAIKILSIEDALLPSAYGTRGLICMDAGDDQGAAQWLRRSAELRRKQASPNLETTLEHLEHEIEVLGRLGRTRDLAMAKAELAAVRDFMQTVTPVDGNFGGGVLGADFKTEGAVLVELPFGTRPARPDGKTRALKLSKSLAEDLRARGAGWYTGWVTIPETTTLIFRGPDAEALYRVLEGVLTTASVCAGARVVIRQGDAHREVMVAPAVGTMH